MAFLRSAALLWILSVATAQNTISDGDLSLRGRATQSSTYAGITAAINAVDGNMDPDMSHGSCAVTGYQMSPWWRLDLLTPYKISHLIITNRGDCCGERLNGASILIGNSLENNGNNNQICSEITYIANGATQTFECNNMVGRYVNIILPGQTTWLQLCEVQVFGVPASGASPCP